MLLMKDICYITGLNSSTVRYYDRKGLLGEVKRAPNNYRLFDNEDVKILDFIKKARALGFDLEEISNILELKSRGQIPCGYVSNKIIEKISIIEAQISLLQVEKGQLKKHLSDAKKVNGCKGAVCHYIEGIGSEEESVVSKIT